MKIAVITDIHDVLERLQFVLKEIEDMGITKIVCCGDLCSTFIAKCLATDFNGDVYSVFGNNADRDNTPKVSIQYPSFHHMGDIGKVKIYGKKIGFVHYPEVAEEMAESGEYDFVFYGHTHKQRADIIGNCLLLNPGEIMGYKYTPSYAIVDLVTKEYNFIPA
jgi:uncharacterized protein